MANFEEFFYTFSLNNGVLLSSIFFIYRTTKVALKSGWRGGIQFVTHTKGLPGTYYLAFSLD